METPKAADSPLHGRPRGLAQLWQVRQSPPLAPGTAPAQVTMKQQKEATPKSRPSWSRSSWALGHKHSMRSPVAPISLGTCGHTLHKNQV